MNQCPDSRRVILIPAGKTDWNEQDRIQGNIDLPLSVAGVAQVDRRIGELAGMKLEVICSAPTGPGAETARRIAEALGIKSRQEADLMEVDLGLWQGMHLGEFREKQPTVYRQWIEQPDQVVPPQGEAFKSAQDRLIRALEKIVRRYKGGCLGVVLGELSLALVQLRRENGQVGQIWELLKNGLGVYEYVI